MIASLLLALVALPPAYSGVIEGGGSVNCSQDALAECTSLHGPQQITLISNKEELDHLCPRILEGLRCIDRYTKACFDSDRRANFNMFFSETSHVFQEMCQEGSVYRGEFLKHSPCIGETKEEYNRCAAGYQERLSALGKVGRREDQIRNHCCSLEEYLECSKASVKRICDASTVKFASNFLDRMAGPLIKDHCKQYFSGEALCEPNSSSSQVSLISSLLVPIIVLTFSCKLW